MSVDPKRLRYGAWIVLGVMVALLWKSAASPSAAPSVRPSHSAPAECSLGRRFVITPDSVGPFSLRHSTMGGVMSSCTGAGATYESLCCYMAMIAKVRYPGVQVEAEQAGDSSTLIRGASVVNWELTGDSIYFADGTPVPVRLVDLARFGRVYAQNPDYDDNDGPKAYVCSIPWLSFRIINFGRDTLHKEWLVDPVLPRNRRARIDGVQLSMRVDTAAFRRSCERHVDSLLALIPS